MKLAKTRARRNVLGKASTRMLCGASVIALLALPTIAQAQDQHWDGNKTTPGTGGTGEWSVIAPNWSPAADGVSGPYTVWDNAAIDNAIFEGIAGTVTVTSPITVHDLTFDTNGYTLNGGALTLAGTTPTITTNGSLTTINSVIAGSSGLTKAGGGQLALNGINTFTGDFFVNAGRLTINGDAALGAAANRLVMANGTYLVSTGALDANRTVELSGGRVDLAGAGVGSAYFTGAGGIRAFNGVTLANDANDFTGDATFFVNGSASFTSVGNIGEASSLGAGDTIRFVGDFQFFDSLYYRGDGDISNRSWEFASSGGTSGSGLFNQGAGTLTLTGDITVDTGSKGMVLGANTADLELLGTIDGSSSAVTFRGTSPARSITLGGANTYTGATSIDAVTVKAEVLADTGIASSFGTGTAGGITITNGGVLSYTGGGSSSNRDWTIAADGSILNEGGGALTLSGAVDLGTAANNSLTLGGSFAGESTLSGIVSGTGDLISDGAGTWALGGTSTRTGAIIVEGGTLRADNASAFGTTTGVTVNGGTLDLGGFDLTAPSLEGTGGAIALGAGTLTVDTTDDTSYAGSIIGNGGLVKAGVGTLTFSGANTYTGDTSLNGGGLTLDFSALGAPASNIIASASTLNMAGGRLDIIGADGAPNSQSFNGLNITAGSNRIAATSGAGGTMTVNFGAITRTGGLVDFALPASGSFTTTSASLGGWATVNGTDYAKVDGGDIVAFTAADYTNKDDAANWLAGEVISDVGGTADTPFFGTVTGSQALGGLKYTAAADSTVTIGAGETLGVDGTIIVASSVSTNDQTISGGSLTGGVGGSTLGVLQNGEGNFTVASAIVNNGGATGFTKGGSGLVNLTGANLYTGVTTLSGGTLAINTVANGGAASSIGAATVDAANLVIESGTLRYDGTTATTDRGFTLVNGGPTRTIEVANGATNLTFGGLVTSPDDAGFAKTGAGTLTLANGSNDYIGVTTISSGTLAVSTLANGGEVSSIGSSGSDAANLVLDGGTLDYLGTAASSDRSFTLGAGNGGIGVSNPASTLTLSGTATGTGGLHKEGAGTLMLTGINDYTGGTVANGGTLVAGSVRAFGGGVGGTGVGSLTVNSGATVDLADNSVFVGGLYGSGSMLLGDAVLNINSGGTFTGAISGTGGISITNSTQTMLGCNNNYTGVTSITSTLTVDCLADGGQESGIGAASSDPANLVINGTLDYTGGSVTIDRGFTTSGGQIVVRDAVATLEFTGVTTGAGFIKDGAGTLVLTGASTRNGTTQIDNGTLRAGTINAFGSGRINFANAAGATVDLAGFDTTVAYLTGGGPLGGNITLGTATLTLNWGGGSASYAGAISGTGGLILNGGIVQTLTGCDSDYSGVTTISVGVLAVSCLNDGSMNSSIGASTADASNLVINGGTLRYVGAGGSTDRQFTLGASGGNALDASGTGAINFASNAPLTFSGIDTAQTLTLTGTNEDDNVFAAEITNNGTGETSLTKTGTGTWILTNPDSTYTGITTISGGVLGVDKLADGGLASSLGASSADAANLVIGNNSTLRYTGTGDTTNRLFTLSAGTTFIESSGTGAVVFTDTGPVTLAGANQNRTIALGGTNTGNNTLAGSIGDAGTGITILAKNDGGTWVLTGDNTYSGNTVINDGTLKVGGGGTTGSIVSDTINLGSLVFDRSDTYTYDGVISDIGNVEQAGAGTTILTGDSTYTGGTTISDGTLQLGNGGASGSIVGDVVDNGVLGFNRSDTYTFSGAVSGSGEVSQIGTGTTILTADNSYSGGTSIADGTLQLGNGGTSGSIVGDVANDGALVFDRSDVVTFAGLVSGVGTVEQAGTGTTILTADNTYAGGTTISDGTLQLGNGGTSGGIVGDVTNNATLAIDRSNDVTLNGVISGTGTVNQIGTGTTTLAGDNSYTGATNVDAGTLFVNGDQSAATGQTNVASGATLGGNGIIGGDVVMTGASTLAAGNNDVGTLTINGDLTLSSGTALNYEFGEADVVGGSLNDLINVGGHLVLDGTVNVTVPTGGDFGAGIYRMFNYGTLDDQGLTLGTMPSGSDVAVQTSVAGQVNLVNSAGLLLNFWDGDAGPKNDGAVNGGNGTWQNSTGNNNWTGSTGDINAGYDDGGFAIFAGTGGTVTVDNGLGVVSASGMQFASDGYTITGNPLTLVGPQSIIRVGDGTVVGAGMTATIASELTGTTQLVKADLGTLVLTGTNSYTGGTLIDEGTLSISADTNLGDAAGAIAINTGTLQTTADLATSRAITLDGAGTLLTDAGTSFTVNSVIDGAGSLAKNGTGTLLLTGVNTYGGGTTIAAGTLQLGDGGTTGSITGDVVDNGTLAINRSDMLTLGGVISGTGALAQLGTGTTILTGENSYTGGTTITAGTLQVGDGGTSGSIVGDVANNGTLVFNRADDVTFAGVISGSGNVVQNGAGTTVLTGISTYAGDTIANAGELRLADGGQITSTLRIFAGNNLGESGTITVDGAGSALNIAGTVVGSSIVGDNGTGTLNVTDGGVVTGGLIRLGNGATGQGTLNVSGEGSSYTTTITGTSASSLWRIGGRGEGIVNVTAGGDIQNSGDIWFGAYAGGEGTATVSGTGSTWDIGGALRLVNGSLSVLDGGVVHADSADIGYTPLVSGDTNVLVSGAGSRLETTADFRLNAASGRTGVLTIADGGTVAPGSGTLAITGGNAALNIGGAVGAAATAAGALDADGVTMANATNRINFNHTDTAYLFDAAISGAGAVNQTGSGTTILTANNSYTGGTTITDGALQLGNGGTSGSIVGNVANDGTLIFNRSDDVTFAGLISGAGDVEQAGAGMTVLIADNSYTGGTTISAGALQLGDGGTTGSIVGDVANEGMLIFNLSDSVTFAGAISGTGAVNQLGTGSTILTADNSYTGGTTITAGTLQLGDGGTTGSIVGDVANEGVFAFNRSDELTLAGLISGSGVVNQDGAGATILTGANTYTGATNVNAGTLIINGDQSGAIGLMTVNTGGTLGGIGMIGGNVIVADGGTINPGDVGAAPGALGIVGNLDLAATSTLNFNFGQANVPGGPLNDLINVGGDLVLDGTLNVQTSGGGSFDPGVYRVINYAGGFTNNGLDLGTIPSPDFYVQTSIPGQVNLVNTSGLTLRYWDGDTIASKNNGLIEGGNGLWQNLAGNDNWTEETGALNAPFTDAAFAVFMGAAGTVTIDDSLGVVNASGMQFLTDGYAIQGDAINLAGAATSAIRVGDGTAAGAGVTATIAAELAGTTQLVKADLGTLILTGTNSYSGGTAINGGTLQIASDANLGEAASGLSFDGGALHTTADVVSGRAVDLAGAGTFLTDAGTTLTIGGTISGVGGFAKDGAGTLILTAANTYAGATDVNAGTLLVNGDQSGATGLTSVASGATLGGIGIIGGDVAVLDGGTLAPGESIGTLTIDGNLSLTDGSLLDFEFGEAGVAGGAFNDLVNVGGDLTLDGTIEVSVPAGGDFGPGIYRVFNYGGVLTDSGLALGAMPGGSAVSVQTAIDGQVNLVNTAGLTLSFWDGTAGPKNNGLVEGGDGVWRIGGGGDNWTDAGGAVNADYAQDSFAIFSAAPGTVTVDNSGGDVLSSGMQFASDGYVIAGGPLTLTGAQAIVQVGDSSTAGAGYTATIDAALKGAAQLVKTDAGTLVLSGANTYTGGTAINGGTLRIASDANFGDTAGGLSFDGGTLNTTADIVSGRAVELAGAGTLLTDAGTTLALTGTISGAGALTKNGAGSLVLTAENSYLGGTTIAGGTLQLGNGGTTGGIIGDVANDGTLIFDRADPVTFAGVISGTGSVEQAGAGTTVLIADNSYIGGTTISGGTLQIGDGGTSGSIVGDVANEGVLAFNRSDNVTLGGTISGTGTLEQIGTGTTILAADNSYTGGTTIAAGTLQLGNGGTSGSIVGDVTNDGTLTFNRSDDVTFAGLVSGSGSLAQLGSGTTILTGANSYAGATDVAAGTLLVNGDQSLAAGLTSVASGATLGGIGTIGGDVTIADGGVLSAGAGGVGALTINGDLALSDTSGLAFEFGEANVPGGAFNDLVNVGGDLTLDGTIDVAISAGGSFGPGVYRVFNYGGALADNGLTVGGMPTGTKASVQTVIAGQVNLVNTAGLTLNFWDGAPGPKNDGAIDGGDGVWRIAGGNNNWTDSTGALNADYAQDSFAIFQGAAGTVTVDDAGDNVLAAGMQFASDGYVITGDALTLTGTDALIRVGDGSAADAGYTATIATELTGSARLVKDLGGTLVLSGANTYTGGTAINGGTLRIASDANLGDTASGLSFDGGTLNITADIASGRAVELAGDGTIVTDAGTALALSGTVAGPGSLTKGGAGSLVLTADNNYTGGTTIAGGMLQLGDGGTTGSIVGDVANDGTLAFNRSDEATFAGLISGSGSLAQLGSGTTILTGANSYAGATNVAAGTLVVNGDQSLAAGLTSVASGATLGGTGIIGGDVTIADGGALSAGAGGVGTLTINGDLALGDTSKLVFEFGEANVPGGPLNDLVEVGGDLTLDGTVDVTVPAGGSFGPGVYRMIDYAGALTDNGVTLGAMPSGSEAFVQTAIANQVNLVDTAGLTLNFWDGTAGPKNDGTVDGGDGVWRLGGGNNDWTEVNGDVNADYAQGSFAIFQGAAGTVTIDNGGGVVLASGMQFAADGYTIAGDALTLIGAEALIRVGDGSAAGAGYTATIGAELTGAAQLVKTDAGTLVLSGANTYTGGTAINGGTLRIASDTNLGDAAGGLSFDSGTLNTTADIASGRSVELVGAGTVLTDAGTTLTLNGTVSGAGALAKRGAGTLVLAGSGSNGGGISVGAGTLLVNGDFAGATGAIVVTSGATLGGVGIVGGDVTLGDDATLAPGAGMPGTLTVNGNLSLAAGSNLAFEFGEANVAGGALNDLVDVGGDLVLDGTIDVSVPAGGAFGAGIYRVFNYGGALTDNGLTLGTLPVGSDTAVQTSIAGQVNLVNSAGLTLNFWDGAVGPKNDGVIAGGDGTWQNSGGNDNWTDATGAVNAAYSDGGFAVFSGTGGTVTVDNSLGAVTSGGMQFAVDGYTITGEAITLFDAETTIRVGDGSTAGADYTTTVDAVLAGDSQVVKTDAGTLVLSGANSYTGGTAINGGTVQIAEDANLGDAAGDVTLDGGTLATSADLSSERNVILAGAGTISAADGTTFTLDGLLSGPGALTKQGAGTLLLTGDNSGYAVATTVAAGTLAVDGILGSAVAVDAGARLEGSGLIGSIANSGVVAAGRDGFGTLTVAGAYTGSGGVLEIEAELGGDDSRTDRLVVGGGTSGSTEVAVINRGGLGAQTVEGIKIIDVTGGASDGSFTLDGDYTFEGSAAIVAGAYGYRLYQGGVSSPTDGDWYLRSALLDSPQEPETPLYQPGTPLYENYAQTLQTLGSLPTMQERVGNRRWASSTNGLSNGIWGRMEATRSRPEARLSTTVSDLDADSWKLQMGVDRTLSEGEDRMLVAGLTAQYGEANAVVRSVFGNGTIDAKSYSIGATLTWYGPEGFYADGQAQLSWFDTTLESSVLGTLADGNDGKGQSVGLELGKRTDVGGGLTLTPQMQMTYQNVEFDAFADPFDAAVAPGKGDSLKSRWGISVDHQKVWDNGGTSRRSHLYGLVNLSYEWLDGTRVDVSGTPLSNANDRLWGEIAVGGSLSLSERLTLYTEASANSSLRNFGDSYSLKGTAGVRLAF